MTDNKIYLELNTQEINDIERRYNYLPANISAEQFNAAINHSCLSKTVNIARAHNQRLKTQQMEKNLQQLRNWACNKSL